MRCRSVDRLIERYVDDSLPGRLAERLEEHLRSCDRCARRFAEARAVDAAFRATTRMHAPESLVSRVMNEVYREAVVRRGAAGRTPTAAPLYRRLGYSFVMTAALLVASLFVPRIAYPNLLHSGLLSASLGEGKPAAVAQFVEDAGQGVGAVIGRESVSRDRQGGDHEMQ